MGYDIATPTKKIPRGRQKTGWHGYTWPGHAASKLSEVSESREVFQNLLGPLALEGHKTFTRVAFRRTCKNALPKISFFMCGDAYDCIIQPVLLRTLYLLLFI